MARDKFLKVLSFCVAIAFAVATPFYHVSAEADSSGEVGSAYGYWDITMFTSVSTLLFQLRVQYVNEDSMGGFDPGVDYYRFADFDPQGKFNTIIWTESAFSQYCTDVVESVDWSYYNNFIQLSMVIYPIPMHYPPQTTDYIKSFATPYTYTPLTFELSLPTQSSVLLTLLHMRTLYFFPDGGNREYSVNDEMRNATTLDPLHVDTTGLGSSVSVLSRFSAFFRKMWSWFSPLLIVTGIGVAFGVFNSVNNKG